MNKSVLAVAILSLCSLGFGQSANPVGNDNQEALLAQKIAAEAAPISPFSTADCAFTFTSGAGLNFLKFCVTANGNITVLETPQGREHIAVGTDGEGYAICDLTTNTVYDDFAEFGDSGNWDTFARHHPDCKD